MLLMLMDEGKGENGMELELKKMVDKRLARREESESPPPLALAAAPMHVSYEEETSRNNSGGDFIASCFLHLPTPM
jgi:hypothetical protein